MASFKEYDFDPNNLPSDVLQAIGLVAACSAQTENIVQSGITGCIGVDFEFGAAITTHMAAPLRDHVLRAVAEIKIDDLDALDALDQLLDDVNEAFRRRNAYLHHTWCRDRDTNQVFTSKTQARGRVEMELLPMPIDQIKSDAAFIYTAGLRLYGFMGSLGLHPTIPASLSSRAHKSRAARKKRREARLKKT